MKKKPVWMFFLAVSLFCLAVAIDRIDDMEFHGLRVMPEEKLAKLTENLGRVDSPRNAEELILLDGHAVPYDRNNNLFYVSQPMEGNAYAGTFTPAGDNCALYLQKDDALEDKQDAIAQGRRFKVWFVTEDTYAISEMVFTGLPMVCIRSEAGKLSVGYGKGNIVVHNPDDKDIITMSVKESAIETKINHNSGTISFKLYKKQYDQERDLSLLGLGKRTSWKLYPVYEKDNALASEIVANYVWNCICAEETLQRGMEYAEVIVDGEYKGLYYLAPKVGKGYLGLGEEDRAYECEEALEDGTRLYEVIGDQDTRQNREALAGYEALWQEESEDFAQIDIQNYIDYNIYLQAACAVQNSVEEHYVIARKQDGIYKFYKMPERSKFIFGLYPSRIGWQSVFATENIMEDAEYARLAGRMEDIWPRTAAKWEELRQNGLSTDRLLSAACFYEQRLADSGYITREEEPGAYGAACENFHELIRERMDNLDHYYKGTKPL